MRYQNPNLKKISALFRFGIRQKMVLVLLSVLIIALTGNGLFTLQQQERDVLQEIKQRGEDITRFASESLVFSVVGFDYHAMQLLLDEIVKSQDILFARVTSKKGNTMAEAGKPPERASGWVKFDKIIMFDGDAVGYLSIGLDTARIVNHFEEQQLAMLRREAIIIVLIAIGEFLALSYLIIRPVTLISNSLSHTMDEEGRIITHEIPVNSHDEFGQLATQFNGMRTQLNDIHQRLQNKIELADGKLRESNTRLMDQSDELRRMNDELKRLSITDPLTGLYNRRQFERLMETEVSLALRHGQPTSILIVDVDFFKRINDTYGHKSGDTVLRRLAKLLTESLRGSDIVCRIGGEEFVALCHHSKAEDAILIGEKLRKTIEDHSFAINMEHIPVTVTVGVATMPDEFGTRATEDFFQFADIALYYGKEHGRNRVIHYSHIATEVNRLKKVVL